MAVFELVQQTNNWWQSDVVLYFFKVVSRKVVGRCQRRAYGRTRSKMLTIRLRNALFTWSDRAIGPMHDSGRSTVILKRRSQSVLCRSLKSRAWFTAFYSALATAAIFKARTRHLECAAVFIAEQYARPEKSYRMRCRVFLTLDEIFFF